MSGAGLNMFASVVSTKAENGQTGLSFYNIFKNVSTHTVFANKRGFLQTSTILLRSLGRKWKQHCLGQKFCLFFCLHLLRLYVTQFELVWSQENRFPTLCLEIYEAFTGPGPW